MKIAAIIPARGNSKRVPGKNIKFLCGKPLLAYSIEHARRSQQVDRVFVTTDDSEIEKVALEYGAEVIIRPKSLAEDTTTSEAALQHALDVLETQMDCVPDTVLFLQCTSPFRKPNDIDTAIRHFGQQKADSLFSATRFRKYIWTIRNGQPTPLNYDPNQRWREQDFPAQYQENGSLYLFTPQLLREKDNRLGGNIAVYEMDYWSSLQIDSEEDFCLCEYIMKNYWSHQNRET